MTHLRWVIAAAMAAITVPLGVAPTASADMASPPYRPRRRGRNLEPWRPEVSDEQMLAAGCNPGGIEEPF